MNRDDKSNELLLHGTQYLLGRGVTKDEGRARALLVEAAELDNPDALHLSCMMLAHGHGGPFDRVRAWRFLKRAAEMGHLEAVYCLGYCSLAGGMGNVRYSREALQQQPVPVDEIKGLELLHAAAERGHGLAALRIAEHAEERADGDSAKLKCAVEWYEKGAPLGEPNCLIHLADFHILGKVLPKDRKKARLLYRKAVRSDDACAKTTARQRLDGFDRLEAILKTDC